MDTKKTDANEPQAEKPNLFEEGPIHVASAGEVMFEGGFVGGLHLGQGGDRLPGADPLAKDPLTLQPPVEESKTSSGKA
jgi:hypothetical protein